MRFFLKEWPDETVTLMTETGHVIWTFDSVEAAIAGWREWAPPTARKPELIPSGRCNDTLGVAA
jgi:hypothetical protein